MQKEADTAAKEKVKAEAAVQKEAANAEKERLKAEAAEKKQVQNAERDRQRTEAAAEKEKLRAQKEAEKEEQRKSKPTKVGALSGLLGRGAVGAVAAGGAATAVAEGASRPATAIETPKLVEPEGDTVHDQVTTTQTNNEDPFMDSTDEPEAPLAGEAETSAPMEPAATPTRTTAAIIDEVDSPASPPKSDSKVKSWFKTRFRSGSKTQKDDEASGFVGGAALTGTGVPEETAEDVTKSDSERNVALAGRSTTNESDDMYGGAEPTTAAVAAPEAIPTARSRSPSISSLSSSDYDEPSREVVAEGSVASDPPRGRRGFKERFLNKIHSKEPNSATTEKPATTQAGPGEEEDDIEEARDTFTEEKLAPPPKLPEGVADDGPGPALQVATPSSRERSKFTEEL